jgi:pyruvate dehydrogenase E1 component alpha subunit
MTRYKKFKDIEIEIYKKMSLIRKFEKRVISAYESGNVSTPVYLSIGQESIAATLATFFSNGIPIFAQHRAHSYFLAFNGDPTHLMQEITSSSNSWSQGSGGSASISSKDIQMFGHSGLMGDQVPIAIGYALVTSSPVLAVVGDASAEEDYVMSAIGYAVKRKLPIVLICEDNNFSILTEKFVRREWKLDDVAKAYGAVSFDIEDKPQEIWNKLSDWNFKDVLVLNINTERHNWHAGIGQDAAPTQDRLADLKLDLLKSGYEKDLLIIDSNIDLRLDQIWS